MCKKKYCEKRGELQGKWKEWLWQVGAAGAAKLIATVATYPHEVIRTRLRQAPKESGKGKYRGLVQCFQVVWKEEGLWGLYGGLTAHLLRVIPNAVIIFGSYELVMSFFAERVEKSKIHKLCYMYKNKSTERTGKKRWIKRIGKGNRLFDRIMPFC
ncbi:unnamed protein product [Pneumocystis jirovecii]|uniref:Mitochondrial carrier protein n=1 Tax=Pneumocystis jirovecii TaxID=42068 RepID=L0PEB7_PNEJI|nr:unnamed protein product [Pneumocystis jirovecii]